VDPRFRNVALIAASLGLLVSLFFALRANDDETTAPTTTATTAATTESPPATTAATTTAGEGAGVLHLDYTISGGRPVGGIARDSVARGRVVVIRVTSDVADEVHVHGYDLMKDVAPGAPETIRFTADTPGLFEIELEELGVQIAELEVRP
jgi:hypothetical protein